MTRQPETLDERSTTATLENVYSMLSREINDSLLQVPSDVSLHIIAWMYV